MKQEALKQSTAGICDPVYQKMIQDMLSEHRKDPMRTALVFLNSFDFTKDDIEEYMETKRIYAEVFEIDKMRKEDRLEYVNCIGTMFGSK